MVATMLRPRHSWQTDVTASSPSRYGSGHALGEPSGLPPVTLLNSARTPPRGCGASLTWRPRRSSAPTHVLALPPWPSIRGRLRPHTRSLSAGARPAHGRSAVLGQDPRPQHRLPLFPRSCHRAVGGRTSGAAAAHADNSWNPGAGARRRRQGRIDRTPLRARRGNQHRRR